MSSFEIGSTVGDYQIIGILGAGGMGKVYKVRNAISDRVEAMKVLLPDLAGAPELADRFVREIKVQASLEHPNIAALHTAMRVENQLVMLMEFVEGETLEDRLKRGGPLPVAEAANYIGQVLAALAYAHQRGVIHRDIKPANMMLTPGGTVKLMDFGIAKAAADRRLTMTGTTMGSLYYMSPEQIKGEQTLDARSDLYSVGVSLYELVTGKHPFDGDSQFAIMSAHLQANPVPPISIDPRLPQALNDVILLSVAKDAGKRFQTAEAFRNALISIAGGAPAPAPAPKPAAAPAPPPVRAASSGGRRGLWIAAGALATIAVAVAVIQFAPWRHTSAAPPPQQPPPAVVQTPAPAPAAVPAAVPETPAPAPPPPAVKPQTAKAAVPVLRPTTPAPRAATPAPVAPPARQNPAPAQSLPQQLLQQQSLQQQSLQQRSAPAPNVNRAELQQVREQLVMLGSRAAAVQNTLQNLQRTQAASGLGLRSDMVEAATLMRSYLDGSSAALNAGDAASAKSFMEKAERQIERLEKFLGR